MDDKQAKELATLARNCWEYAKTVGPVYHANFRKWFENRARQLYRLNDAQIAQIWNVATKMYS